MNPIGKEAFVMRWVFAGTGMTSKDIYTIDADGRHQFYIGDKYREGTIDTNLIFVRDDNLRVKMEGENASSSITTFAWLPRNYLIDDDPDSIMYADHHIAIRHVERMKQDPNKSFVADKFMFGPRPWLECDASFAKSHHRGDSPPHEPVRFCLNSTVDRNDKTLHHQYEAEVKGYWQSFFCDSNDNDIRTGVMYVRDAYKPQKIYFVQPPSVMSMFLDYNSYLPNAKERIYVRYGYPLFIGIRYPGKSGEDSRGYFKWFEGNHVFAPDDGNVNHDSYWVLGRTN